MVNQAIKEMVIENIDEEAWKSVCKEANISDENFDPFEQYPDSVTGNLVGIICKKTKTEAPELLENFGKYWIKFAKTTEYSSIMDSYAVSAVSFIESLDSLHTRLSLIFVNLEPPSFTVDRVNDNEILVHYFSKRDMPLEFFVIGLLKGIFDMFDQTCSIELLPPENSEKAILKIKF